MPNSHAATSHVVYVCSDASTQNFNACLARISLMLSAWFSFVLRKKNWIRQSIQEKCLCEPIRFYIFLCHKPDSGVQLNEESSYYCSLRSGQPHRLYALSTNQCSEVGWISEVVLLCWPSLSLSLWPDSDLHSTDRSDVLFWAAGYMKTMK